MDELIVAEALAHVERMLTKCGNANRKVVLTEEVVNDLLDLRSVLSMGGAPRNGGPS